MFDEEEEELEEDDYYSEEDNVKNNVNDLDLLFDSNPFILNISSKDIKRILNKLDNKLFYYNSSNIIWKEWNYECCY